MNTELGEIAQRTDAAVASARAELVTAIRRAYNAGMTQTEIAQATGRSQAEVNRLLRFHGTGPRARALREHSREIRRRIADAGGSQPRVFGSVARGDDHAGSDIDLVFSMREPLSLMQLSAVERELADLLGFTVDLVPESSLREDLRHDVLETAVPL